MTAMILKPGVRLQSVTCSTRVIVVAAPPEDVDLWCGGAPMTAGLDEAAASTPMDPWFAAGAVMGKRYTDGGALEVLVTSAGAGTLSVGPDPLEVKDPRRLPSSD